LGVWILLLGYTVETESFRRFWAKNFFWRFLCEIGRDGGSNE
jgi:hypothetical protein